LTLAGTLDRASRREVFDAHEARRPPRNEETPVVLTQIALLDGIECEADFSGR